MKSPLWQKAKASLTYAFVVLLSAAPILALGAANVREVSPDVQFRPLVAAILAAFGLWALAALVTKDRLQAAIFSSLFVFLFLSYGHFYNAIEDRLPFSNWILWILILLVPWLVQRLGHGAGPRQKNLTSALNVIGVALVAQSVYGYIAYPLALRSAAPVPALDYTPRAETQPDVYYIIADSYTRADSLAAMGLDNSAFVEALEQRGFYVGECSVSNYGFTTLSLASTLNMDYLWNVFPQKDHNDPDSLPIYRAIKENRVRSLFEAMGYQVAAFETGYAWTEWHDADLYLHPDYNRLTFPHLQPFEQILLANSALRPFMGSDIEEFGAGAFYPHYQRALFNLDALADLSREAGPKFVFAHLLLPHPPYIFNPDGSLRAGGRGIGQQAYLDNVQATNALLLSVLDDLLQNSAFPPVIILQGDHGSWNSKKPDRFTILNAYHLPGNGDQALYPGVSPVNSFRVVFNAYFGGNFPILEDLSIHTDIGRPYRDRLTPRIPSPCD